MHWDVILSISLFCLLLIPIHRIFLQILTCHFPVLLFHQFWCFFNVLVHASLLSFFIFLSFNSLPWIYPYGPPTMLASLFWLLLPQPQPWLLSSLSFWCDLQDYSFPLSKTPCLPGTHHCFPNPVLLFSCVSVKTSLHSFTTSSTRQGVFCHCTDTLQRVGSSSNTTRQGQGPKTQ